MFIMESSALTKTEIMLKKQILLYKINKLFQAAIFCVPTFVYIQFQQRHTCQLKASNQIRLHHIESLNPKSKKCLGTDIFATRTSKQLNIRPIYATIDTRSYTQARQKPLRQLQTQANKHALLIHLNICKTKLTQSTYAGQIIVLITIS